MLIVPLMPLLLSLLLACTGSPSGEKLAEAPTADEPGAEVLLLPAELNTKWANARCNDGTPFGLTLRRGTSDTWLIKVAGGHFCDDVVTICSEREHRLTTGPTAPVIKGNGLVSTDWMANPTFYDANHVELHYCSSDFWLGEHTEKIPNSASAEGWYFSGRTNMKAAMELLTEEYGLTKDAKILLIGSSAGGIGVIANLDLWTGWSGLKAILDGAWIKPQADTGGTDPTRWGSPNRACAEDRIAEGVDPVSCLLGPVWYPYFAQAGVPLLIQNSGLDLSQLKSKKIKRKPELITWKRETLKSFADIEWLYSEGKRYHVLSFDRKFGVGPPGQSFREVVDRFWAGGEPERVLHNYN